MVRWLVISGMLLLGCGCQHSKEKAIETAVAGMMERYPASTLQDLYKSFFQDYFGPGHMIHDTAAAMNYLNYELSLDDYRDTVLLEKTGYHGNFYRVNLILIRDGVIPKDEFFHHFLESVRSVEGISIEKWKREWQQIMAVIGEMSLGLDGFETDRAYLDSLLSNDEYVVHHSDIFMKTYAPHYRIIHRHIFDEHLSGYLR